MLQYEELLEAIQKGHVKGDSVMVVRKNGRIFDYVLPHESVRPHEVVTIENVNDVLKEMKLYTILY